MQLPVQILKNIIQIGTFIPEKSDSQMDSFCAPYHFKSLITECLCYKNPDNLTENLFGTFKLL